MKKSLKKKLSLNKQTLAAIDRESGKYVLGGVFNQDTGEEPPTNGGTCATNCYSNCNNNCPPTRGC